MRMHKLLPLSLSLVALLALSPGCKGKDGKGTENPDGAAEAEANPIARLEGYSTELTAQVDAVMKPIADAEELVNEIGAMPEKLGLTMADLKGMFQASFQDGKVDIAADLDITAEAKAELEAILAKAKLIGEDLRAMPETVKIASVKVAEIGVEATGVATTASTALQAKLANPLLKADAKASIQADIAKIGELKTNISTSVDEAKASIMGVPAMATEMSAKVLTSFAGSASAG